MEHSTSLNNPSAFLQMTPTKKFLLLDESHKNVNINYFKKSNYECLTSNMTHTKLDITFTFGLQFKVDMKICFPTVGGSSQQIGHITKFIIWVQDDAFRNEIRSYTNYLQRQKNLNFAITILKKLSVVIEERKLILDMLTLHSEGYIKHKNHEDGGVLIIYSSEDMKYFKSHWKIQFDCTKNIVMDYIDFTITKKDVSFHKAVKFVMDTLVSHNLSYDLKVNYWWKVIEAVKMTSELPVLEIIDGDNWDRKDFTLVRSLTALSAGVSEQYEIVEDEEM